MSTKTEKWGKGEGNSMLSSFIDMIDLHRATSQFSMLWGLGDEAFAITEASIPNSILAHVLSRVEAKNC